MNAKETTANMPTTDAEMESLVRGLMKSCGTHAAWLSIVRYGLDTLLENQPLLIELITREAVRIVEWNTAAPGYVPVAEVRQVFAELGLKLEVK